VPAEEFIKAAKKNEADIIAMSALLSTTRANMPRMLQTFTEDGIRDKVKVMIGGAPVTQDFADSVRADGYAPNTGLAVSLIGYALSTN